MRRPATESGSRREHAQPSGARCFYGSRGKPAPGAAAVLMTTYIRPDRPNSRRQTARVSTSVSAPAAEVTRTVTVRLG